MIAMLFVSDSLCFVVLCLGLAPSNSRCSVSNPKISQVLLANHRTQWVIAIASIAKYEIAVGQLMPQTLWISLDDVLMTPSFCVISWQLYRAFRSVPTLYYYVRW